MTTPKRKIRAPVVLAGASTMLTIGISAFWLAQERPTPTTSRTREVAPGQTLIIDDRTAERAAQSYFDAWRRRAFSEAALISEGPAHDRAQDKLRRDESLDPNTRELAQGVWRRLTSTPLEFEIISVETEGDQRVNLTARTRYTVQGEVHQRSADFEVVRMGDRWKVRDMNLGEPE